MDELDVAFTGVITTGAVGVGTLLAAFFGGRADRRHARRLAQDERLFDSRVSVYEDALAYANRDMLTMDRIYPRFGPQPEPPPPVGDDEWARVEARVGALGSREVQDAIRAFMDEFRGFIAHAKTFQMMEAQGRKTGSEGYVEIDKIRTKARDRLDALAQLINEELTAPVA